MAISGVPDVVYFPVSSDIKAVGVSATASSQVEWEGTQILRHPKRINDLYQLLANEDGSVDTEEIESYKGDNLTSYNAITKRLSPNISDTEEIYRIIEKLVVLKEPEKQEELLEDIYGLKTNKSYYFYGLLNQSLKNEGKDLSKKELNDLEKDTIDIMIFAQKNNFLNNIDGNSPDEINAKKLLINYIYSNITNVIDSKKDITISEPKERKTELELSNMLLNDLVSRDFNKTSYIQYQLNDNGEFYNQDIKDMLKKAVYSSLIVLNDYLKSDYKSNPNISKKELEMIENNLFIVSNINLSENNLLFDIDNNSVEIIEKIQLQLGVQNNLKPSFEKEISEDLKKGCKEINQFQK